MTSDIEEPASNKQSSGKLTARIFRFKWAAFSAVVIFFAVYWIDWWFSRHGLRREVPLLDNFLLSALVFALGVAQQLRHERTLKRQLEIMRVIGDVNHHTRNALQVIVGRSVQSMADANAIEDIREAVKRIDWCLREILPAADERSPRKPPAARAQVPSEKLKSIQHKLGH